MVSNVISLAVYSQGGLGACVLKVNAVNFPSELAYQIDGGLKFEF